MVKKKIIKKVKKGLSPYKIRTNYIRGLEKEIGRRIDIENKQVARVNDWADTCFDMKEKLDTKEPEKTQFFILGLLLGGLLLATSTLLYVLYN